MNILYLILLYKIVRLICLKQDISKIAGPNVFSGKLYKCIRVVLGYFTDIHHPTLDAWGVATSVPYSIIDGFPRTVKWKILGKTSSNPAEINQKIGSVVSFSTLYSS